MTQLKRAAVGQPRGRNRRSGSVCGRRPASESKLAHGHSPVDLARCRHQPTLTGHRSPRAIHVRCTPTASGVCSRIDAIHPVIRWAVRRDTITGGPGPAASPGREVATECGQPFTSGSTVERRWPAVAATPPTSGPVAAPTSVSRRHQIPSSNKGRNVAAATANAQGDRAPTAGCPQPARAATERSRRPQPRLGRTRSGRRSAPHDVLGDRTPATVTVRPVAVARNAPRHRRRPRRSATVNRPTDQRLRQQQTTASGPVRAVQGCEPARSIPYTEGAR